MLKIADEPIIKFRKAIYGEKPKEISAKSIVKLKSQSTPQIVPVPLIIEEKSSSISKSNPLL